MMGALEDFDGGECVTGLVLVDPDDDKDLDAVDEPGSEVDLALWLPSVLEQISVDEPQIERANHLDDGSEATFEVGVITKAALSRSSALSWPQEYS